MSLLEMLSGQLDDGAVQQIGNQLGVDSGTASQAISAALPMLMGALAKNSADSSGAQALAGALDRDHDGSVLDDVAGFLGGGGAQGMGEGILGHMLGGRQTGAASALGQMSGMDKGSAGKLMAMLAPLVMGALAKQKRQGGLDSGGLANMLGQERQRIDRAQPQAGSMLDSLLDRDGDGQVADDLAQAGMKMLGSFLGRRR